MASARLLTTVDRAEAQAMCAMLQAHGIEAEVVGVVDSARVGVGAFALPVHVDVPAEDEGVALRLLAAERAEHLAAEAADREAVRASVRSPKRRIAALGLPVLLPGLAHVYAGRSVTGWMLAAAALPTVLVLRGALMPAYVLVGLCDAVLAFRAIGRNAGPPSTGRQVATALAVLVLSVGVALTPMLWRERAHARLRAELGRDALSCTARELRISCPLAAR